MNIDRSTGTAGVRTPPVVLSLLLCLTTVTAFGVGPLDQRIADAPNPLSIGATGVLSGAGGKGTGTVLATKLDGTTGYVAILTANHVAKVNPTDFAIGSGFGGNPYSMIFETSSFTTYTIVDAVNNPQNHPVDMSLMLGRVENLAAGSPALTIFNLLTNNLPTITHPTNGGGNPFFAASGDNPVGFTEIGYGHQGEFKANIPIGGNNFAGYEAQPAFGERLFQNNTAISNAANAVMTYDGDTYFQPLVNFNVKAPNNQGEGAAMPGDSGGPMYTQAPATPVFVTVHRDGSDLAIPLKYTNSLSAILVKADYAAHNGQRLEPPTFLVGSEQSGVPIDLGMYNWMQPYLNNPQLIPEPSTWVLAVLGAVALVLGRLRAAGKK